MKNHMATSQNSSNQVNPRTAGIYGCSSPLEQLEIFLGGVLGGVLIQCHMERLESHLEITTGW
jgi:hypothetical protein